MTGRSRLATAAGGALLVAALLMLSAAPGGAQPLKAKRFEQQLGSAHDEVLTTGAIATATARCPTKRPKGAPLPRAISGGFTLNAYSPTFGTGRVFESRKVGQRSWRVSAQSLSGKIGMVAIVNCLIGAPKTTSASSTVSTAAAPQVGPMAVASCRSGKAIAGGFSTPPPFVAPDVAMNTVIGSVPSGPGGWQVQAISNQASTMTGIVYCAKRKTPTTRTGAAPPLTATPQVGKARTPSCGRKRDALGGGFSQLNTTATDHLIPLSSLHYLGDYWSGHAFRIGGGSTPVTLTALSLCG